jgi:hypothetical protein
VSSTSEPHFMGCCPSPRAWRSYADAQSECLCRIDYCSCQLCATGARAFTRLRTARACVGELLLQKACHTAFIHDFANFSTNCEIDRNAIETLGASLGQACGRWRCRSIPRR